jgi:AcrR family transcriptional regulator
MGLEVSLVPGTEMLRQMSNGVAKSVPRKKPRRTREERSEQTRQNLIQAGARIVGRYGYEGASIARITTKAKVALGTFYRHFGSRQEFFDQLLPAMGDRLLAFVQSRVDPNVVGAEREEQRLRAYFEFLEEHPWYHRLLNESEVMAPRAHAIYFNLMASGLVRSFERSQARGELKAFHKSELKTLAYIVMASRVYLAQQWGGFKGKVHKPPVDVLKTYNKFIQRALFD